MNSGVGALVNLRANQSFANPTLLRIDNIATSGGGAGAAIEINQSPSGTKQFGTNISSTSILNDRGQFVITTKNNTANPARLELTLQRAGAGPTFGSTLAYSTDQGLVFQDTRADIAFGGVATPGISYIADYSASYTDRSCPDVEWVNSQIASAITEETILAEITSITQATYGAILPADPSGGSFNVNVPGTPPTTGQWFTVVRSRNTTANTVTILTSTDGLYGTAANVTLTAAQPYARVIYVNPTIGWIVDN